MSKILVADDNSDIRESLADALRCLGHDVTEAEDGGQEWEILHSNRDIEILVSDDNMPIRRGSDVIKELKNQNGCAFKAILISGYGVERTARECHADAWLEKPFSLESLNSLIKSLCGVQS